MPLDNKISNIIGTKLPQWVLNQLETRANKNTQDSRDNDNILYLTNKSAWVRLVSSVDIGSQDLNYFKNQVGANLDSVAFSFAGTTIDFINPSSLAKEYVLFGGTSKYLNKNSYGLRSGINNDGAYGMLGKSEVQQFGYKPMPGITNVTIDTQGRLGSVRAATINFKCWDKSQLDIIDALYFKLGFTMFLEWGHTYFYYSGQNTKKRDPNKIVSTELYSIDPFEQGLNKEDIQIQIAKNSRNTEGNYDAMLGIVTNFNFTYTQDGGYDCSVRLMGLGVLGDSIKINNSGTLPALLIEEIVQLNNTLLEISKSINNIKTPPEDSSTTTATKPLLLEELISQYLKYDPNLNVYSGAKIIYNSFARQDIKSADLGINGTAYGEIFIIRKLKGYIPLRSDLLSQVKVKFDGPAFFNLLKEVKIDLLKKDLFKSSDNVSEQIFSIFTADAWSKIISELRSGPNFDAATQFATRDTSISYNSQNKLNYTIGISRRKYAETTNTDVISPYYPINDKEFVDQLTNVLNNENNEFIISNIDFEDVISQKGSASNDKVNISLDFTIPFTRTVKVKKTGQVDQITLRSLPDTEVDESVKFTLLVKLKIQDTRFIKSFTVPVDIIEPIEFKAQKNLVNQDKVETVIEQSPEEQKKALETQVKQSLNYQSTLEIMLRTIQVHALNRAINKTTTPDLEIGREAFVLNIADDTSFLKQIFSTGIFSTFIQNLITDPDNKLSDSLYSVDIKMVPEDRFRIQSKYGFATSLLGNKENIVDIPPVNFGELLKAYVVPYQINQEIVKGTYTNHPVYISLGLLLMILNHACTIYDTKISDDFQTPLVYIDFNPETNFCLTNAKQLSTDPWTCLIPFQGGFDDYKSLFDKDILIENQTAIKPTSGSIETIPLFNPQTNDKLSGVLPKIKFGTGKLESTGEVYRGKMMNILLSIDYLVQLAQQYSYKDGTNSVYLKTFIEQILNDVNKSLGNFNAFRLSYNDSANTFQIIDDQFVPSLSSEEQVSPKSNTTELPLSGKFSIAKSLDIKSEVSSKLSNMLAISANSNFQNKATLSTNGSSYGFINTQYVDRYISNRGEITGSNNRKNDNDTLKISAAQFNMAISDFYSKINPSQTSVSHATNYYIEKMTLVKNNEYATRAAAMIPVSVNFTTDGISGLSMGQAFTVPDILLPYTYTTRKIPGAPEDHLKNVGFAVVGLTHTIENNQWNTAVRANMIYLKDKTEFTGSVVKVDTATGVFGINTANDFSISTIQTNYVAEGKQAKEAAEKYLNRTMTDTEWSQLVAATFAEASENQTENAWVMAVILNRTRTKYKGAETITDTLTRKSQFQAVTGTSVNGNQPSKKYINGPNKNEATSIYGAVVKILESVPKNYLFFTSNNPAAYGDGTDISFLSKLKSRPGAQIIGQTVFSITG